MTIADVLPRRGSRLVYVYDWGDEWRHDVEVVELGTVDEAEPWAECLAGEGACPPEDCGGPPGYHALPETDPAAARARFSVAAVNRRLGRRPK